MSRHVSIETGPDGQPLACKRATDDHGHAAIRSEAARLSAIDHPGVTAFVELRERREGPVLLTRYAGPRTLATIGPVTTERAATLIADLSSTVADLHALGTVHGALRPEHVLVAGDRVVLCGLAADPEGMVPADDVLGIGLALGGLLDPDLEEEPIPDRRPWRRVPWQGYRHRALLTLADQATDDEPTRRPGARALADTIRDLLGTPVAATSDVEHAPAPPARRQAMIDLIAIRLRRRSRPARERHRPPRPRRALVLGAFGTVVVGIGAVGATNQPAPVSVDAEVAAPTVPSSCPARNAPVAADVDGDGCPNGVRIGPGWIEVDDERFRVGRIVDDVRVGDWDGDGLATVALLRPDRDEVWLFASWDPNAAVTAQFVGRFPDSDGLVRGVGPGRDLLLVRHPDGTTTEVLDP